MSGDSPNAFTNENVFDFKESGRSSPAPTTSKDHQQTGFVTASVLVEPNKEKGKDKDKEDEEDSPDFSSPILNQPDKDPNKKDADENEQKDAKSDDMGRNDRNKDEQSLLNGGMDRLPSLRGKEINEEENEDDTCLVNCIYYTMECCKCSIV